MTTTLVTTRHPPNAEIEADLAELAAVWPPGWRCLDDRGRGTEVWLRDDGAWFEVHPSVVVDFLTLRAVADALRCSTAGPGRWVVEATRNPDGTVAARVLP